MDAAAYLKKQGWRGSGHSLDYNDRGIKKPLQISKKVDALGVGIQKYGAVSDQWWMRAYDQGLKDLGKGVEGDLEKVRKHGHDRGGLYARFVKGQPIPGTIEEYLALRTESETTPTADEETVATVTSKTQTANSKKRKSLENTGRTLKRKLGNGSDEPVDDVRVAVKMYVDEAIRRGIISPKSSSKASQAKPRPSSSRPHEADMRKVLALAGLSEGQNHDRSDRQHRTRALKRAAVQHLELAMDTS